jgi:hypothetical protein
VDVPLHRPYLDLDGVEVLGIRPARRTKRGPGGRHGGEHLQRPTFFHHGAIFFAVFHPSQAGKPCLTRPIDWCRLAADRPA